MMEAVATPPFRLTPRPYQYEAVAALLARPARVGSAAPARVADGDGQNHCFCPPGPAASGRSLILAHRDELIQQAMEKLRLVDPSLSLGVVQAARDEHAAPTVVASVQTLSRRSRLARLVRIFRPSSLTRRTTPPRPPTGASWSTGPGIPTGRWWSGSRRPGGDHHPCGRSSTALSIRKPCWR